MGTLVAGDALTVVRGSRDGSVGGEREALSILNRNCANTERGPCQGYV